MKTNKLLIVLGAMAVAILLLVQIVGLNRKSGQIENNQEKILELKQRIASDSARVVQLQIQLKSEQDSVEQYRKLYKQTKTNYTVVTRYYQEKIKEVKGFDAKMHVALFESKTDSCRQFSDSLYVTRLSNIVCANVLIVSGEMYLAQRDTLQQMNQYLEAQNSEMEDVIQIKDEVIISQNDQLDGYRTIVKEQDDRMQDLEKQKKKADRKIKRAKTLAIIGGSAAIVLTAVLILQ